MRTQPESLPSSDSTVPRWRSKKRIAIILIILVLAIIAGGAYYWQQQKLKDRDATVAQLNAKVAKLNIQLAATAAQLKATHMQPNVATSGPAVSDDDQVITAATNYCNAMIDPGTKQQLTFTLGTRGRDNNRITYSVNKEFAVLNADCGLAGKHAGSGSDYVLKKVNGTWTMLYRSQQEMPDQEKAFNVPASELWSILTP